MGIPQMPELQKRYGRTLVYLLTGGVEELIWGQGGRMSGFTVRGGHGDVLLIVRARFEGKPMVAFAGSSSAAASLKKLEQQLRLGQLRWRPDKYANGG